MTTQAFNFLWLNLDLPARPDPEDGSIREPIPPRYIDNLRKAGLENPATDIILWVDSKRLSEKQFAFLQAAVELDMPNTHVKDLRSIPAYDRAPLFNEPETNPNWRNSGQTSIIWRQVDTAKVLVSLQGDYDQSFFADLDHAHLAINSAQVQGMLKDTGIMIGSQGAGTLTIENQLWGFTRERRPFFETYYVAALKKAYKGENAWDALCTKAYNELHKNEGLSQSRFVLPINDDGTSAEQTGHEFRTGSGRSKPSMIDKGELSRVFNSRSPREPRNKLDIDTSWEPAEQVTPPLRNAISSLFHRFKRAINAF